MFRRRRWWLTLLASVLVIAPFARPMASPPPAQALSIPGIPSPCDLIPNDILKTACKIGDPTQIIPSIPGVSIPIPGIPTPGGIVKDVTHAVVLKVVQEVVSLENTTVSYLLIKVIGLAYKGDTPIYTAKWWVLQYGFAFGIGVILALYVMVGNLIRAVRYNDPWIIRDSIGAFAGYFFMCIWFPALLSGAVYLCDNVLAGSIVSVAGITDSQASLKNLLTLYTNASLDSGVSAIPLLIPFVLLLVGIIGAIILWFQILYRYFGLYLVPPVAVVAFSLSNANEWGKSQATKCRQILIGLILYKVILVTVITFALLVASTNPTNATPLIEVAALLASAPFLTWMIYRAIAGDRVPVKESLSNARRHGTTALKMAFGGG